jgi:hypothetical protein
MFGSLGIAVKKNRNFGTDLWADPGQNFGLITMNPRDPKFWDGKNKSANLGQLYKSV